MGVEDITTCVKLNNKFVDAVGRASPKKFEYFLKACSHAYVVRDQERIVAFMFAFGADSDYKSPNYRWHNAQSYRNFVYVDRIVVAKDYQNMKVGTQMYKFLDGLCKKAKADFVVCEVNATNKDSMRFHQRQGFEIISGNYAHSDDYKVNFLMKRLGNVEKPKINRKVDLNKAPEKPEKSEKNEEKKESKPRKERPPKEPKPVDDKPKMCRECKKEFSAAEFKDHLKSEEHLKMKAIKAKLYEEAGATQ